ncbi:MAG: type II toxin-antitoxin system VapC family toxin [Deltaproteobacteria bacterium]|nr:type II toxin-antitoxin system VapC family toxin [Deltaproteobacteria bacterium]MBN2671932.1 type II toxin-antitoxin system VapC family toxin [Deltaproteobacteria bacterium]
MVAYLDSSVLLQHVLCGDSSISKAFQHDSVISSELLNIECMRVIHRYRLTGALNDAGFVEAMRRVNQVLDGVSIVGLSDTVRVRAGESFPVVVKTLDALHLATAIIFQQKRPESAVSIFSYDQTLNRCAQALGFHVEFEASPPI